MAGLAPDGPPRESCRPSRDAALARQVLANARKDDRGNRARNCLCLVYPAITAILRERFAEVGLDIAGGTPDQFAATIRNDIAVYARLVKDSGRQYSKIAVPSRATRAPASRRSRACAAGTPAASAQLSFWQT